MDAEPRSTLDLIHELEAEAKHFTHCFLVVGFEKHNERVFATRTDRLEQLNELIEQGGIPLGFIGVTVRDDGLTLSHRVLGDHTGAAAERAKEVLLKIEAAIVEEGKTKHGWRPEYN